MTPQDGPQIFPHLQRQLMDLQEPFSFKYPLFHFSPGGERTWGWGGVEGVEIWQRKLEEI